MFKNHPKGLLTAALSNMGAVSYTHLIIRLIFSLSAFIPHHIYHTYTRNKETCKSFPYFFGKNNRYYLPRLITVSYTHLDVYKRQIYFRAGCIIKNFKNRTRRKIPDQHDNPKYTNILSHGSTQRLFLPISL